MFPTAALQFRIVCAMCIALAPTIADADARKHSRKAARPPAIVATDAARRGCTVEDALASQRAPSTALESAPAEAAFAAEALRALPRVALDDAIAAEIARQQVLLPADHLAGDEQAATRDMPARHRPLRFFDRDSLRAQVESIRRLPLVRLFDNQQMSIYLGIDRKGVAGLHLQQRRPDDFEPVDDASDPVDVPLRSVPIETH